MKKQQRPSVVRFQQRSNNRSEAEQRREPGARRRLAIWLSVCTIFIAWAGVQMFHQAGKISAKRTQLEETEQKLAETKEMQQELQTKIQHLKNPEYVAELARKEYYMTKEGEIIIVNPR